MKKLVLSALAMLAMAGIGTAQNLPSYVPANGLIGWWPFNGNANDESGNGNNGTVNGATLTADRFGNQGKAYSFDGLNDFIQSPFLGIAGSASRTISFWMNTPVTTSEMVLVSYGPNDIPSKVFNIWTGYGCSGVGIDISFSAKTYENSISINQWNNFVVVLDSVSGTTLNDVKVYKNGDLISSICNPIGMSSVVQSERADSICFGRYHTQSSDFYFGSLDDIAIYNRALSQQEITALYQGANTTANCIDLPSNLQQGLVGYWPFCGNANDESGSGNNGTVNGATLTSDRFGIPNKAFSFIGGSNISVPHNATLNPGINHCISIWYKVSTDNSPASDMLFKGGPDDIQGRSFFFRQHATNFSSPTTAWSFASTIPHSNINTVILPLNQWHHSVINIKNSVAFLYLDNIKKDSVSIAEIGNFIENIGSLRFGNGSYPLDGSLDDIAIWNRALTQEEISQLYNQGICKTSITVTDTLLIHTGITAYNPVAYQNTLKVWPNPGNQDITLDAGNLQSMQGWKYKVANTLGQTVVNETAISQQQTLIDLSTWGGNGIYYLHLINPQGHAVEIKKIVLAP